MNKESSRSELDAVLDTMVDGVIMINENGIIERYNPSCSKIFGYAFEEVVGQNIRCLMPEPYHTNHDSYISNYKATDEAKIIGIGREVSGLRKDGAVFPMYLSVGELPRGDGRAFVGIIRDLTTQTEQKESFEKLQQAHFHLSRVAAMDQMGAAIAHELNQPLTAVMNYTEAGMAMLKRQANDIPPDKMNEIMSKAAEQAKRAANILSRLRQFIETGDMDRNIQPLVPVIKTTVDLIVPSYKNNGISISLDFDDALPDVLFNEIQIQQVLVNLIRNACEAMLLTETKHLVVSCVKLDENNLRVGVLDTGIGITDEQYETLYEPFSSSKSGGLGVGLSISRTIIANHEGRIWAERNSPQGTCFYFTLPIA